MQIFNALMGYISSLYRLNFVELSCVKITHLTPGFHEQIFHFSSSILKKKKTARIPIALHYAQRIISD